MILARIVFQAKMGKAQQVVKGMKEMVAMGQGLGARNVRILTDLSGTFDTVVQEMEFDSIEAYFQAQERMFADPRFQQASTSDWDDVIGGHKEFYTIE